MLQQLHITRPVISIAIAVVLVHALVIWLVCNQLLPQTPVQTRKAIIVQSIALRPTQAPATQSQRQVQAIPQATPKAVSKPEAKPKVESKPETKPKVESKPKNESKPKKVAEKKPELPQTESTKQEKKTIIAPDKIAQVRAHLNKIQDTAHKAETSANAVAVSSFVETDSSANSKPSYEQTLADRLRMLLTLPDYGDVKIKMTLDRNGKVLTVAVLASESDENRQYVLKTLPSLKLPPFNGGDSRTFQLILSND